MNQKHFAKYIIPPVMTSAVILFCFSLFSQYPFGDKTVVWCDLKQQSVPLLAIFREAFLGESSLFYSFSQAGGTGIFPALCFFVFSPFSLISLLFKPSELMLAANIILIVKLAAAAFCASIFFNSFFPKLSLLQSSSLSVMYSLCGFSLQYFQTLTWLDTFMFFPLLAVALKKLLNERRPLPFVLLLAYTMITGFYLSVMLVIFLVLAVFFYLLIYFPKKERGAAAALFTFSGVTSALLASPVLIPCFKAYLNSARSSGFVASISKYSGVGPIYTKLPLIMCAAVVLPLIFFYFFELGKRSQPQKRRFLLVLLLLMLLPFFVEKTNAIWHMGSYQAFPCRFAYITSLILLSISAESLSVMNEQPNRHASPSSNVIFSRIFSKILPVVLPLVLTAFSVYFSIKLYTGKKQELTLFSRALWGNEKSFLWLLAAFVVFALIWSILLVSYRSSLISKRMFSLFFAVICVVECSFNSAVYLGNIKGGEASWNKAFELSEKLEASYTNDDTEYFRVKTQSKLFDVNWLAAMGCNSLGHYTSLTDENYLYSMKELGYSGYWMEIGSHGSSFFMDSLLCHKYTVSDLYSVYKNENYIGLGVFTQEQPSPALSTELSRPEIQNKLYAELTDSNDRLFTEYLPSSHRGCEIVYPESEASKYTLTLTQKDAKLYYTIDVTGHQSLYFDCFDIPSNKLTEKINDSFSVTVNGAQISASYPTQSQNGMLFLGEFEDETVKIELKLLKNVSVKSFGVFGLDMALLGDIEQNLVSGTLTTEKSSISGSFTAEENGWLLIQIPFDEGFTAMVNGEPADISRALGTFMAVPVSAGENTVSLCYFPSGMKLAIILFAIGCAAAVCLRFSKKFGAEFIKVTTILQKAFSIFFFATASFILLFFYLAVFFI
ncbi:MAG: YfhO family protein [Oscillospiraceae bacterium]|nr:YfhO family protein [Oscillospiraceae bacterium]